MSDPHLYSVAVVVPAAYRTAAEALATATLGRDCTDEISVGLSATGAAPASHYWAHVALTASEYTALASAFFLPGSAGETLGAEVYTTHVPGVDDRPGASVTVGQDTHPVRVIGVGDDVGQGHPLARRWTRARVLAEIGLVPVRGGAVPA